MLSIGALLGIMFLAIVARLFWVQLLHHDEFRDLALTQYQSRVKDPGLRGDLLDRNGRPLVRTLADPSLVARPQAVRDPRQVAARLATLTGRPAAEIEALLGRPEPLVEVVAHLTAAAANAVRALELEGVHVEPPGRRLKLERWDLLGDLDRSGRPVEGVERSLDRFLAAEDGWEMCYRNARGGHVQPLPDLARRKAPRHGDAVLLTIDSRVQWLVEEALGRAVEEHQARCGSAVLVDVWTGEIIALAGAGGGLEPGRRVCRLRAVEDQFEPGSAFKPVAFAAAIELGLLNDDSLYYGEQGRADFGGFVIRDVKKMGWLCAADVLAQSSNICTAKIGEEVGARQLYAFARAFGFGRRAMVELPGEQAGMLRPVDHWSGRSAATVAIGQEVSVTALQLAMCYAAIANGGILWKPTLVREVRRPDGSLRRRHEPEQVRRVIREETAATIRRYLTRAVDRGTGRRADPGVVSAAGKTGTAQKARPDGKGYAPGDYVACFAGFFPAEEPELALVVVIEEPRRGYYGGEVAAPVFAAIARGTALLATPGAGRAPARDPDRGDGDRVRVPDVRLLTLRPAVEELERRGLGPTVVASGTRVADQDPAPGVLVKRGTRVRLRCGGGGGAGEAVPDLIGLTLREALGELRWTGLEVKARGNGVVIDQAPAPGSPLPGEGQCRLVLAAGP